MNNILSKLNDFSIPLVTWWNRHRWILWTVNVILAAIAIARLIYEFDRLLFGELPLGAIDLKLRYDETLAWFTGNPVYFVGEPITTEIKTAVYPPASYVMFWPLMGQFSFPIVRWLWAASSLAMLGWLIYLVIGASQAKSLVSRLFLGLLILACYATAINIGNGQLTIHLITLLVAGSLLLCRKDGTWWTDILGSLFITLTLIKPTVSAPFFWLVLLLPGRLRPGILIISEYGLLAFISSLIQRTNPIALHQTWLKLGVSAAAWGSAGGDGDQTASLSESSDAIWQLMFNDLGYNDIHSLLGTFKLNQWNLIASLIILFALAVWIYYHRTVNFWLILSVTAIVARLWVYHRVYDDLLLLLPIISLWRINLDIDNQQSAIASVLLGIMTLSALVPASFRFYPGFVGIAFRMGQLGVWLSILALLLSQAKSIKLGQKLINRAS